MSAVDELNEKQRKFVLLYMTDVIPAGRCYEAVGYNARGHSADQAASRMLKNVKIRAALRELHEQAAAGVVASLQETLEFLTAVMRTPLSQIDEDSPLCMEFSETVTESGVTRRKRKVDPIKAIQELNRLKNRYSPSEVKVGPDDELAEILKGICQTGSASDRM